MFSHKFFIMFFITAVSTLHSTIDEAVLFDPRNVGFQATTGLHEKQLAEVVTFLQGQEVGCSWVKEYPIITNLINTMGLRVGCEVGVAYGFQSQYFLEHSAVECLYSVDPYMHFDGYDDFMNFPQHYFDVLFYRVQKRLADFGERSVLLRKKSVDAAAFFKPSSLDFVYIDADHSYEQVLADLYAWMPTVRSGGLISGDDYLVFPTTALAVNSFVFLHQLTLHVNGNKWWFIKP